MLLAAAMAVVASSCGTAPTSEPTSTTTQPLTTTSSTMTTSTTTTTAPPRTTTTTTTPWLGAAAVVNVGPRARRLVALTFDAGSDVGRTVAILEILEAQRIRATFGLTGVWATTNPALVRRIAADGDQIVNHSWNHTSFTGGSTGAAPMSAEQIAAQLRRADEALLRLTGRTTRPWFRPPYGDRSALVDQAAGAAGYRYDLLWTVDTLGWKGTPVAQVVARVVGAAQPGEIVLMHVGAASTDAAALPQLISALRARGYGFATVAGLFS